MVSMLGGSRTVKMSDVMERCTTKGFKPDAINACLDEYEELNVWQVSQKRDKITFIWVLGSSPNTKPSRLPSTSASDGLMWEMSDWINSLDLYTTYIGYLYSYFTTRSPMHLHFCRETIFLCSDNEQSIKRHHNISSNTTNSFCVKNERNRKIKFTVTFGRKLYTWTKFWTKLVIFDCRHNDILTRYFSWAWICWLHNRELVQTLRALRLFSETALLQYTELLHFFLHTWKSVHYSSVCNSWTKFGQKL